MCTIGAALKNKGVILFKNCDLDKKIKFHKPKKERGHFNYIAFTRENRPGIWAGINEFGLGIATADTYTKKKYKAKPYTIHNIFKGNEKTIAENKDVNGAIKFLKKYYKEKIKYVPDLIIVGDKKKIAVFEFTPPNRFGIKIKKKNYILRTNQFKILKGGLSRKEDLQSYTRIDNAKEIMSKSTSLNSIKKLLRNHKTGPSKFSVCRHGKKGESKTQASAIMQADKNRVRAFYVINNFPCKEKYKEIELC